MYYPHAGGCSLYRRLSHAISSFPGGSRRNLPPFRRCVLLEANQTAGVGKANLMVDLWVYCRDVYRSTCSREYRIDYSVRSIALAPLWWYKLWCSHGSNVGCCRGNELNQQRTDGCCTHFRTPWCTAYCPN